MDNSTFQRILGEIGALAKHWRRVQDTFDPSTMAHGYCDGVASAYEDVVRMLDHQPETPPS